MISKPFHINHIDVMNLKIQYNDINTLKSEAYTDYEGGERAKTYIDDGRVIFACGIQLVRKGVGQCWVIPSIYVDKYKIKFAKEIKKLIDENIISMQLHRLQTTIVDEFKKWIEFVGFYQESVLKQIGENKQDEYMYVRLF